jgi:hypothetical protein
MRSLIAVPIWVAAAACLAFPVIDVAFNWTDTVAKRVFILTALVSLLFGAVWAAKHVRTGQLRLLPFAVLLVALGHEGLERLNRLRQLGNGPEQSVGASASLLRPITTTDLVTQFYEVPSRALRVNRLRVAQITDVHISPMISRAYFEHALDTVVAQKPDLILMTGDYVSRVENLALFQQVLPGRLRAPLGVFAVLGNHDFWTNAEAVRQLLTQAGITLVGGTCARLPDTVGRVAVCGTEAPWGPELDETLREADLSLVLSHTPDNIYDLSARGASAVFAGHLHGGQARLPGFGALVTPSRYGRRFDEGHFRVAGTDLFVSTGLGADDPPLRIYCRPDIIVVDFIAQGEWP